MPAANPLTAAWATPFGVPPFAEIAPAHFPEAFAAALAAHRAEIAAIADCPEPAGFANTIEALENSGRLLNRVSATFWNLSSADTSDELQAIERDIAPKLAAHWADIQTDPRLFARIDAVLAGSAARDLSAERRRVLERTHLEFVRAGARLDAAGRERLRNIVERLAALGTQFSQNVLADEKAFALVLDGEADLAGLPGFARAAAATAAEARGLPGKHVVTLARSSIEPFLTFSTRSDLREKAFKAWIARGESGGPTDNRAIVAQTLALRLERARLIGYDTFAAYKLDDTMAKTPAAVRDLLDRVWAAARRRAGLERDKLQALAERDGLNDTIAPWDWRFYAERLRKAEYDLDEESIKPFLPLDAVIEAAFDTARRLFDLSAMPRGDVPTYHPDVRAWEIARTDGTPVGLFLGDYFARPSKRSGAWMSSFRGQEKLGGDIRPIIVNVMNFSKGDADDPALLSFDDARTLFHEFGHALHGLLSDVTYPSLAGTAVSSDFVELPSQLYEHWFMRPEVLARFARHYRTGEPMPKATIDRLVAARTFNQGFATVEYVASALVDMDFHALTDTTDLDPLAFEASALTRIGMPREIVMRHRTPHFQHVFSGDGYSAGYYSYLWSEVLDADAFAAFEETGDIFDRETAERLRRFVYGAGNLRDPAEAYVAFRGRLPSVEALLHKRGLAEAAA